MKLLITILFSLLISGCISESSLKPVVPMQIIHANSAKVWILESLIVNQVEKSPQTRDFKTAYIFYENGEFLKQKMVHLGSNKGEKGNFSLTILPEHQDTILYLNYKDRSKKSYYLKLCTSKEMRLQESENVNLTFKTLPNPSTWY